MKEENEKFKKGKNIAEMVIQNLQEKPNLQSKDIIDVEKMSKEKGSIFFENEALEKEIIEIKTENIEN
jgi:hypothetical protein